MNVLNGSKIHLARNSDSRYAVCRRVPIHGAVSFDGFKRRIDSGYKTEYFCKNCLKRFGEMS